MKSLLAALIVVSFAGIVLFGFVTMLSCGMTGGCCLLDLAKWGACPGGNELMRVNFHAGFLQSFSQAVVAAGMVFLLALLFALAMKTAADIISNAAGERHSFVFVPDFLPVKKDILRWLALHEKRDVAAFSF